MTPDEEIRELRAQVEAVIETARGILLRVQEWEAARIPQNDKTDQESAPAYPCPECGRL